MTTSAGPPVISQPGQYDFYRCRTCQRLLVGRTIDARLAANRHGAVCRCGSYQLIPCAAPWYAVFLPRVWPLVVERVRALGWRGLRENWRADRVARLLAHMPRPYEWASGVPSTGEPGPIILASSQNLARVIGDYVRVYSGDTLDQATLRSIAVGGVWEKPVPPAAPVSPADQVLRDLGPGLTFKGVPTGLKVPARPQ